MSSGQSITIKIAGDRPRTTGSGQNVKIIPGIPAEHSIAFLKGPLTAELEQRSPDATIIFREAHAPSIELVGLKPAEEVKAVIGELIGETLADFDPSEA
ncbi:hypothetical protein MF271_24110 (plasmid) [Deinococcus sp. KNUC1210]|uniref:hypothetical protein n=1 Tax=Deinococcus sp. KNUC1210 TaxID=2917691 RepID=UPI001EF06B2B|nr:hypothetical protein [Deinococcus sp. KNUC1210]ULH18048.1 hypothetical protein MF271_24110 [Deinococcus sp. KNUC1210]